MKTLGIEFSDVGVHCVELESDGTSRSLPLEKDSVYFPAYALVKDGDFVFGGEAQSVAPIYQRRVCSEFIDSLSFQYANLEGYDGRITHSQIAYKFLANLVARIMRESSDFERVVVAVPGHFLESNEKSEERLGLLLGILQDLKLPIAGIVDLSASSLASEGLWNLPEGDCVFHVDLLLHSTNISVFHKANGLERVYYSHQPQYGFSKILDRFSDTLAQRFLKQTAFDVREDRKIERAFYAQTKGMLFNLGRSGEASLEVSTREKSRQMSISREIAALDLASQVKVITQMLLRAVNDFGEDRGSIQIMLSSRTAAIQGLKESIVAQDIGRVQVLPSESAAFGAASLAKRWEVPEDFDQIRVETGIENGFLNSSDMRSKGSYDLSSIRLTKMGKSLSPTHIVCDGLAYELREDGFVIGVGESEGFHLVADRRGTGKPYEIGRLVSKNGKWMLTQDSDSALDTQTLSGIRAGDILEVTSQGSRKQLLLIHCMP